MGGDGDVGSGKVRAGTTSPVPDHKGFKLQYLVNFSDIQHFKGWEDLSVWYPTLHSHGFVVGYKAIHSQDKWRTIRFESLISVFTMVWGLDRPLIFFAMNAHGYACLKKQNKKQTQNQEGWVGLCLFFRVHNPSLFLQADFHYFPSNPYHQPLQILQLFVISCSSRSRCHYEQKQRWVGRCFNSTRVFHI